MEVVTEGEDFDQSRATFKHLIIGEGRRLFVAGRGSSFNELLRNVMRSARDRELGLDPVEDRNSKGVGNNE